MLRSSKIVYVVVFLSITSVIGGQIWWWRSQRDSLATKSTPTASPKVQFAAPATQVVAPAQEELAAKVKTLETTNASLAAQVKQLERQIALASSSGQKSVLGVSTKLNEFLVYFGGSGTTTSGEWTDVPSATAVINTSYYPEIELVNFEAGLSIVGGEVHARLFNKTTNTPVFDSEVYNNTSSLIWKTSPKIKLEKGSYQYIVQIKSTSNEIGRLDGARVKILTK